MARRSSTAGRVAAYLQKASTPKAAMPTVTAARVLEDKSRRIFGDIVSPWLVTDWTQHDYGIDAIVEITRARTAGGNLDATGKRFAVQLKATEEGPTVQDFLSVRVRPEQIRYWLESTEPVLLVLCYVPTRAVFWRWIDHVVVGELNQRDPAWIGQETVSVPLPATRTLDDTAMKEIADVVSERVNAFETVSTRIQ
jgi:hypothetical protein